MKSQIKAEEVARWQRLLEEQQAFEKKHGKSRAHAGPLFQAAALEDLERDRVSFEAGDKFALLRALRVCAARELPIPDWLAQAYILAFDRVLNARARSWDEAFGAPFKKNANLAAIRKRRSGVYSAWLMVNEAKKEGRAVDAALFEEVGKKLNIGKTLCQEFYYEGKKKMGF